MLCVLKKGHLVKDCRENRFFKDKSKEEEEEGEKRSSYSMDNENRKNIEEGIIHPRWPDSVVRNI